MTLASRMGVMNHGQIVQVGTPRRSTSPRPRDSSPTSSARSTCSKARVIEDEPGCRVAIRGARVVVALRRRALKLRARSHRLGGGQAGEDQPQPRACRRGTPATGNRENVVQGVVKEIAYMGDMSIYLVQIAVGKTVRVTIPMSARQRSIASRWDETVYCLLARGQPRRADRGSNVHKFSITAARTPGICGIPMLWLIGCCCSFSSRSSLFSRSRFCRSAAGRCRRIRRCLNG